VEGRQVWLYKWNANGSLKEVVRPDGKTVGFEYDALGRRTTKIYNNRVTRWVWDGNTPLHEWSYGLKDRPKTIRDEFGFESKDREEPAENLITWVFEEGTFKPAAKLTDDKNYSIITDYLGTPAQMYDDSGKKTWEMDLDIYGKVRTFEGCSLSECPFRYQGQYEDEETGLYYNRFRYYSPEEGMYLSQDPIGLAGNNPTLYGYVRDTNVRLDFLGLNDCAFDSGASFLITGDDYDKYIKNATHVGRPDGQFVSPASQIDDLLKRANGDISIIEDALGIPTGMWQGKGGIYRIDIADPKVHNLRNPSVNMSGANELFILGGKTSGGITEGVIDQVPISQTTINKII
jgi:RHS repeat-associated protein